MFGSRDPPEGVQKAMHVNAHLNVMNGKVACPASGQWEDLGHCAQCVDLEKIEGQGESQVVVCNPEVENLATAVGLLARV
jgi:hypothetical protein